jgi:hypothetical protein
MSEKKKEDTQLIRCPHCLFEMHEKVSNLEGFYNWKCTKCYSIIPLKPMAPVRWKCKRPPTPRRNMN